MPIAQTRPRRCFSSFGSLPWLAVFVLGSTLTACSSEADGTLSATDDGSGAGSTISDGGRGGAHAGGQAAGGDALGPGTGGRGISGGGGSGGTGGAPTGNIADADNDGISDADEGRAAGTDTDGDLIPDYLDSDSDNDGIPDAVEAGDNRLDTPPINTDGTGAADFRDIDSDDDTILDAVEAGNAPATPLDSDGDYLPDYRDTDSDNDDLDDATEAAFGTDPLNPDTDGDTISDGDEGTGNPDGDAFINALDDDSDGDGHLDSVEAGDNNWQTRPVDTDFDNIADYLDLDSEQDGLPDAQEVNCSVLGRHGRLWDDSDFDGQPDLAENLVGSDPCDASEGVGDFGVEFFFILPHLDPEQDAVMRFDPQVRQADVFFNVDTTGSMGGEISNLRSGLSTIMASTQTRVSDAAFGVGAFDDFPRNPFGSSGGGDVPWRLLAGITTNTATATAGVNGLNLHNGSDFPESGYEALFQVAAGTGVTGSAGNFGPWAQNGTIGGARFRPGSLPIVLHVTDALAHDSTTPTSAPGFQPWTADYPGSYGDHSKAQALSELQNVGARVIGVQSLYAGVYAPLNAGVTAQMREISESSGGVVPTCAFKLDATNWRCGTNTCCDGTIDDGNGNCILRYTVDSDGNGLSDAAADGIDAIVKYTTFDVFSSGRDDGNAATVDTSLFLKRIEANTPDATFRPPNEPEQSCTPVPTPAQFNAVTTYNNGFDGFAPGTSLIGVEGAKLYFKVVARNTTVPETDVPQLFTAFIDIVDDKTGAILDSQDVVIIVPAAPGGAGD